MKRSKKPTEYYSRKTLIEAAKIVKLSRTYKPTFYTMDDAGKEIGRKRATLYKAVNEGRLKPTDRTIMEIKIVSTPRTVKTISAKDVEAYRDSTNTRKPKNK